MFCTRCGAQNDDAASICRNCSQPLTRTGATPSQRPPVSDAPYPGYQGGQNPGFQGQQPPYANMPPAYPQSYASGYPGAPQAQGASGRAIASLVLMLVGFFMCGPFLSIPAIIMGKQELNAIRTGQAPRAGETLAKLGFYGGIVVTVLYCGGALLYGLLVGMFGVFGALG
jgi:hypothetical protein